MQVREALLIEGSSKFAILCYGIFSSPDLDPAFEALRLQRTAPDSHVHRLLDEGWPHGLLLSETFVANEEDIPHVILGALIRMFAAGPCFAAVCMFDGAFGSYDDIFAANIASQTYAFCFSSGEPVLALDANLLVSEEWCSVVAHAHQHLIRARKRENGVKRENAKTGSGLAL